jgi:hypothetical protein
MGKVKTVVKNVARSVASKIAKTTKNVANNIVVKMKEILPSVKKVCSKYETEGVKLVKRTYPDCGYVYLVHHNNSNEPFWVKCGLSKDRLDQRMKELCKTTNSPNNHIPNILHFAVFVPRFKEFEKEIHKEFAQFRKPGTEWFGLNGNDENNENEFEKMRSNMIARMRMNALLYGGVTCYQKIKN